MSERKFVMVCMVKIYSVKYAPKSQKVPGAGNTLGRNSRSRARTQSENAEPSAKKAGKPRVPSIKNADFEQ